MRVPIVMQSIGLCLAACAGDEPAGGVAPVGDPPAEEGGCPSGVTCVTSLPFVHSATTVGGVDEVDSYGCAPEIDESGPERRYRVELLEEGFLGVELSGVPEGVDVDVHLLQPDGACVDRGHELAGALLPAGLYEVVVDTWADEGTEFAGDYTLTLGLTTEAALTGHGLRPRVARDALFAFDVAWLAGDAGRLSYAISDFSLHSSERRMWIMDMARGELRWNVHVPHGSGSSDPEDPGWAVVFSNEPGSHMSSLGVMRGAERYVGDYGESMRIDGLEPGFNNNVRDRAIVLHPWEGSRPGYVAREGVCDDTWGCPALDDRINEEVADFLTGGGLLLFHYPDPAWLEGSGYLPR